MKSTPEFDFNSCNTKIEIIQPTNLYKWSRHYFKLQKSFFEEPFELIREKQILDFVYLNQYKKIWLDKDTDIFVKGLDAEIVDKVDQADLIIITNQNFSRYPCPIIIEKILHLLDQCPSIYLTLNRHYINIDNSWHDSNLSDCYELAISQWLNNQLIKANVLDLSFRFDDRGTFLSWSIPDRHFFIRKL